MTSKNRKPFAQRYRFRRMRAAAKQAGKSVPSMHSLYCMFAKIKGFRCPVCRCKMKWVSDGGNRISVITLQHDRSGRHRLICFRCNLRHKDFPGDTFYDIPKPIPRKRRFNVTLNPIGVQKIMELSTNGETLSQMLDKAIDEFVVQFSKRRLRYPRLAA